MKLIKIWPFALFLSVAGCHKTRVTTPTDTLVLALSTSPLTLDPRLATDATSSRLSSLIFSGFLRLNSKMELEGEAAERWKVDGQKITLWLRPALRFNDGQMLKTQDLEFSLHEFTRPGTPWTSSLIDLKSWQIREVESQLVVTLNLAQPSAKFLRSDLPNIKIISSEHPPNGDRLVGLGNWRLAQQSAEQVTLTAVRDHGWEPPRLTQLQFKVVRDDDTRFHRLMAGELDAIIGDLNPRQVRKFELKPDEFQVHIWPGLNTAYLLPNLRDPLLAEPQVREALALCLDRESLVRHKLENLAEVATALITPRVPGFDSLLANPKRDPVRARRIISQLGLIGRRLILKTADSRSAIDNGRVLRAQLRQSGLEIDLQSLEWGTFYRDLQNGHFQLATLKWVGAVDADLYRIALHSREMPPGRNRGAYQNAEVDRWLDESAVTLDPDKRRGLIEKVQRQVARDRAVFPLWYDSLVAVTSARVKGFAPTLTGDFSSLWQIEKSP